LGGDVQPLYLCPHPTSDARVGCILSRIRKLINAAGGLLRVARNAQAWAPLSNGFGVLIYWAACLNPPAYADGTDKAPAADFFPSPQGRD